MEDIGYLRRFEDMFDILLPLNRRKSQSLMMMGDNGPGEEYNLEDESIPPNQTRKVMCPLISGLLSAAQDRWIPLEPCPLQIQLEINPLLHQYLHTSGSTSWANEDCPIKTDL